MINDQKLSTFLFVKEAVITYPEITKKISTPRNPLGSRSELKWLISTAKIANPLSPSISALYSKIFLFVLIKTKIQLLENFLF